MAWHGMGRDQMAGGLLPTLMETRRPLCTGAPLLLYRLQISRRNEQKPSIGADARVASRSSTSICLPGHTATKNAGCSSYYSARFLSSCPQHTKQAYCIPHIPFPALPFSPDRTFALELLDLPWSFLRRAKQVEDSIDEFWVG